MHYTGPMCLEENKRRRSLHTTKATPAATRSPAKCHAPAKARRALIAAKSASGSVTFRRTRDLDLTGTRARAPAKSVGKSSVSRTAFAQLAYLDMPRMWGPQLCSFLAGSARRVGRLELRIGGKLQTDLPVALALEGKAPKLGARGRTQDAWSCIDSQAPRFRFSMMELLRLTSTTLAGSHSPWEAERYSTSISLLYFPACSW
mmetsp:Transcript_44388/g.96434  ORF Transcript_44388/g.96434 Transcript_44388/m.96434 type:complete len:203 (+) Transcript_44388:230-838(+)